MRPERAGVELLGQQLPDGQQAAGLRHPGVERRRHEPAGRAALQFLDIFQHNRCARPGGSRLLGTPVDLATDQVPTFVTGGRPITSPRGRAATAPRNCSAGRARSSSATPGTSRAWSTRPATRRRPTRRRHTRGDPQAWLAEAEKRTGTWWEHWADWVIEHSPDTVPAPTALGSADHPAQDAAPGRYVRDDAP